MFFSHRKIFHSLKKKIKIFFYQSQQYFFLRRRSWEKILQNFLGGWEREIAVCGGHLKYCINWWVSQQRQVRPPFFPMFCTFLQLEKTRIFRDVLHIFATRKNTYFSTIFHSSPRVEEKKFFFFYFFHALRCLCKTSNLRSWCFRT